MSTPSAARSVATAIAIWLGSCGVAHAADPRPTQEAMRDFELVFGLDAAAPALFRDTPDTVLEPTVAFAYGGHVGFLFGEESVDDHRFGLIVGAASVARSASRALGAITPHLVYETGHPLIMRAGLGASIALGTDGFRQPYSGVLGSLGLRASFREKGATSPLSVSPGLTGQVVLTPNDLRYSTVFVGAQVECIYHHIRKVQP